jgi:AcrR family transcriptional regulator
MSARKTGVKVGRTYDASRRRELAEQRRTATLDEARAAFLSQGFAATTVDSVAAAAGVSAATIYKTYGGKVGLIRAICERALEGEGPVPAETRSNAVRASGDPYAVVQAWGQLTAEVSPRGSPVMLVLQDAAATDPEAAALLAEMERSRLRRMTDNAQFLARAGFLRPGVSVTEARDVLWFCTAPEIYELLIVKRRWTRKQFATFVSSTIAASLLP